MALSFDELLSRSYLTTFTVEIAGVGEVELHQCSALRAAEMVASVQELEGDELESAVCACSGFFLKGSDPTDEEVLKLRELHTAQTLSTVYQKGLQNAPALLSGVEDTAKNS